MGGLMSLYQDIDIDDDENSLEYRIKCYEDDYSASVPNDKPFVVRLICRDISHAMMSSPRHDDPIHHIMVDLCKYLVMQFNCRTIHTTLGEISMMFYPDEESYKFSGDIDKTISTITSMASIKLNELIKESKLMAYGYNEEVYKLNSKPLIFITVMMSIPNDIEMYNYLLTRQSCYRNGSGTIIKKGKFPTEGEKFEIKPVNKVAPLAFRTCTEGYASILQSKYADYKCITRCWTWDCYTGETKPTKNLLDVLSDTDFSDEMIQTF